MASDSPLSSWPAQLPWRTTQPKMPSSPVVFISLLAKQGPVQTSQVRASTYSPKTVGAAWSEAAKSRAPANARIGFMAMTPFQLKSEGAFSERPLPRSRAKWRIAQDPQGLVHWCATGKGPQALPVLDGLEPPQHGQAALRLRPCHPIA